MKNVTVLLVVLFINSIASAQSLFSLKDCLEYAEQHSSEIKALLIQSETANWGLKQSRNAYIPSIAVSNQHNLSTGRVLDPTTYQFLTNRSVYDMSIGIGGSMTLFSGFERAKNIQKEKLNFQSALLETEKARNDIALNVTALFLNSYRQLVPGTSTAH